MYWALFIVMSVTPWDHIRADKSPFVELFLNAGIPVSAIIMNLVVLSSVMSSMNSGVFSTVVCCSVYQKTVRHREHLDVYQNAQSLQMV